MKIIVMTSNKLILCEPTIGFELFEDKVLKMWGPKLDSIFKILDRLLSSVNLLLKKFDPLGLQCRKRQTQCKSIQDKNVP